MVLRWDVLPPDPWEGSAWEGSGLKIWDQEDEKGGMRGAWEGAARERGVLRLQEDSCLLIM